MHAPNITYGRTPKPIRAIVLGPRAPARARARADKLRVTSLASWYGSNRTLAEAAGAALDGCDWVGVVFAGGMSEIPYIAARTLQVNDLHRHLINLARVVRTPALRVRLYRDLKNRLFHPDELRRAQERCLLRERYEEDPDGLFAAGFPDARFDRDVKDGDVDWAADYFTCAWMSRHGSAGTAGELAAPLSFRFDAGGGDSNTHFRNAARGLVAWTRVLRRANFSTLDFRAFLAKCQDAPRIGIYSDSPFPGPGDLYKHAFTRADHLDLARGLSAYQRARVVCRFYDHPLVRELYPERPHGPWTYRRLRGRDQQNQDKAELLLIRNGPVTAAGAEGG